MSEKTSIVLVLILTKGHELVDTGKCTRLLREERCVIGRGTSADWELPDPANQLSRRHCVIEWKDEVFQIADTSSNGTFVNDWEEPIPNGQYQQLYDGDIIKLGNHFMSAQIIPEGADARIKIDDYLIEPANTDPLADILPEERGEGLDEWIDDQIVSPEDELSEVLNDPLDPPETILRKTTETLDSYPIGEEKDPIPPITYGYDRYKYANPVPFESDSGISSEEGASAWDHNRSESDAFKLPRAQDRTIPEDWDIDSDKNTGREIKKPHDD